ncbi:MXAN_6640 family putative metalloprotease [Euzebya sp.]|uniref:MXAN_6640 family putative metalloprotease n=1 Tax=Euzebya sp. TaxID=1971409 RepID=UPI003517D5AA
MLAAVVIALVVALAGGGSPVVPAPGAQARQPVSVGDRGAVDRVQARPDADAAGEDAFTAPESAQHAIDTPHFRLHWTSETDDATTPQFVKLAAEVFEEVWDVQVDELGWPAPLPDDGLGGNDLVDVYFVDHGDGAYGYAAADLESVCRQCDGAHGYLVLDNDYVGFAPDPEGALRSTAAHEFSHLVQFGMAYYGEAWAYEATAVWLERATFGDVDARTQYLVDFAAHPDLPLTDFGTDSGGFDRSYGAYVWNVWLADRFGASIVREAWEAAAATDHHVMGGYATALAARGSLLERELVAFTAATAAWEDGGFPGEPTAYPAVSRAGPLASGTTTTLVVDHTAAHVADVQADGEEVVVTVRGPKFVAGGIALVASAGGEVLTSVDDTLFDGEASVTLPATAGVESVTLVVVNADPALAEPKPPGTDRPRYLFDDVEYLVGVDVDPGRPVKR